MDSTYKRSTPEKADQTHKIGDLVSSYEQLKALFGEPFEGDGHKTSMTWIVEDSKGRIFTIYDWKLTTLYEPEEEGWTTPDELKKMGSIELSIGGHSKEGLKEFLAYLKDKNAGRESGSRIWGCFVVLVVIVGLVLLTKMKLSSN